MKKNSPSTLHAARPRLLALLALYTLGVLSAGWALFTYIQRQATEYQWNLLEAETTSRLREITLWLHEREEEAQIFSLQPLLRNALQAYLAQDEMTEPEWGAFERRVEILLARRSYESILLLNAEGEIRYHQGTPVQELRIKQQAAMTAWEQRRVIFRDFAVSSRQGTEVRVAMVLPLFDEAGRSLGALAFRLQPYLYNTPLVEEWPAFQSTAEILVFRPEGEQIVYLTQPRFRPIEQVQAFPSLLPAMIVEGESRVAGLDYRGEPSIGVGKRIPNSPWYLVAKVAQSEVQGFLRQFAAGALVLTLLLLVGGGVFVNVLWRRQVAEAKYRAEAERREAVRASETALKEAQRLAHVGSWEWDLVGDHLRWSDEMFRIAGYDPHAFEVTVQSLLNVVHPGDRERVRSLANRAIESGESFVEEHRVIRPDASMRVVASQGEAVKNPDGKVVAIRGTWLDITERRRVEEELRESEWRFRQVVELEPDILYRVSLPGHHAQFISPAVERLLGFTPEEWQADPEIWVRQLYEEDRDRILDEMESALRVAEEYTQQYRIWHKDGRTLRWFEDRHRVERDSRGRPVTLFGAMNDITPLKQAQEVLESQSLHDPLTGIANRRYLNQFIEREWRRESRHDHSVGLIMADIDYFKTYNDYYGHQQGDECLVKVGQTLRQQLRRPTDLLVRYGGEEFAAVLLEADVAEARHMAETMRHALEELALPHATSPVKHIVTVSLGVSAVPARYRTFAEALALADQALYRAKQKGRNRVEVAVEQ